MSSTFNRDLFGLLDDDAFELLELLFPLANDDVEAPRTCDDGDLRLGDGDPEPDEDA